MLTNLVVAAAGALAGTAVAKELAKPADQRTWHGEVAGVPYDFRPPTADKIRRTFWDPGNPALFTPHAFGVGWGVNFARIMPPAEDRTSDNRTAGDRTAKDRTAEDRTAEDRTAEDRTADRPA